MFKKFLLVLLTVFITIIPELYSQTKKEKERLKEKIWGANDPDFQTKEVKPEWRNKSAVILAKSIEYEVRKRVYVDNVDENLYMHKRIKLQDKAAVEAFAEMTFSEGRAIYQGLQRTGSKVYIGIKVIKPNGTEKIVDFGDAVDQEIESGGYNFEYKKLAIKDLEVGDILDYYYAVEIRIKDNVFEPFGRITYAMVEDYPTMKHKVNLRIMRKCYLSAKSVNGAPALKSILDSDDNLVHTLSMDNQEELKDNLFISKSRVVPALKFQAFYVTKKGKKAYPVYALFLGDKKTVKQDISEKVILQYINDYVTKYSTWVYPFLIDYMNEKHKKEKDAEKLTEEAYNFFRQKLYLDEFEISYLKNYRYDPSISNARFIGTMSKYLAKKKINHDIIVTISNRESTIQDLLLIEEVRLLIRVNTPKPFFISVLNYNTHYNDVVNAFQGNTSYAINISTKKKKRTIQEIVIPMDEPAGNLERNEFVIDFSKDNLALNNISRLTIATGLQRVGNSCLTNYDYIEDSRLDEYKIKRVSEMDMNKKQKDIFLNKMVELQKQEKDKQLKTIKDDIEKSMGIKVDSLEKLELLQTGLWSDKPELKFKSYFSTKDLTNKVGQNYIFNVGRLIGDQVKIEEESRIRKSNVFSSFPRTYENSIVIKIPNGYQVKGLENLKYNISNSTGGFVSNAELKDDKNELHIQTKKYYNHNYEDIKNWPLLLNYMDAAYEFNQQKILFEKLKDK